MQTLVSPLHRGISSAFRNVTPTRLRLLLFLNCISAIVFAFAAVTTIQQHHHAVQTVGVDAAPSVIAAHEIKIAVEVMDADLADELLYPPQQQEALEQRSDFEKWRLGVSKQLVIAAKNITYGATEQIPIENIQSAYGTYLTQVQNVRDLHDGLKDDAALSAYRQSLNTIQSQILPAADALDKANADVLETIYAQEKAATNLSRGFVLVTGLILTALLLYTQIFLSVRFRRRINVPMLIATICVALFLQKLASALGDNTKFLVVAKEDSYNSIFSLLDARAEAYEAVAAESRWLLDRQRDPVYQKQFTDNVAEVAHFDDGHNLTQTLLLAKKQLADSERVNLSGFHGAMADELDNARFPGEAQAAMEALQQFDQFCLLDAKMRDLANSGNRAAATKMCLGYNPSQTKYPFSKFDDALQRTLQINEDQLQHSVDAALHNLRGMSIGAEVIALIAGMCACLGLLPRIEEYVHCSPKPRH
jgi:hypothetical protein